ncbi:MAG: DEAD/DEAH box helicase [Oscillospiraceae bacterium]|nr:DEAD/DEAH box helicase [Oscillospiraceae bacterium]
MLFSEMKLTNPLLKAIEKAGYSTPTPIQEETIPHVLNGRDILGCAQTGTGKTAAFALPILQRLTETSDESRTVNRPIRALILTPTRELAMQIYENFVLYGKNLSLRAAVIFGGVNQNPQVKVLSSGIDILVATPGRLNDLINQKFVNLEYVKTFVLDEADRMLDMGFIKDVKKIISLLPKNKQTLLFSATMPSEVETLALGMLNDPITVKVTPVSSTVDKTAQSVYFISKADKITLLLDLLKNQGVSTALVFTRTKSGANQVARLIEKSGIKTMAIHGNKSQSARQAALAKFKDGRIDVLVATDIAARGIDVTGLPFVINYNVPEEAESYVHRIGRTGRAGLDGTAITFCCNEELDYWRSVEKLIGKNIPVKTCQWSITDIKAVAPHSTANNHYGTPNKRLSRSAIPAAKETLTEKSLHRQAAKYQGDRQSRKNSSEKFR